MIFSFALIFLLFSPAHGAVKAPVRVSLPLGTGNGLPLSPGAPTVTSLTAGALPGPTIKLSGPEPLSLATSKIEAIEESLASVEAPTPRQIRRVSRLVSALDAGRWSDPVFKNAKSALRLARVAHAQGKITTDQFATAAMLWEAADDLRPLEAEIVPVLAPEGGLSETARSIFGSPVPWGPYEARTDKVGLNEEELGRFAALAARLPVSERHVWIMQASRSRLEDGPLREGWGVLGYSLFNSLFKIPPAFSKQDAAAVILPSFGLLQAVLDAKFGKDAMRLLPGFGTAGIGEIMAGIARGVRFLGLHYPGVRAPETGDGYHFGKLFFTLHDYLHAYVGSAQSAGWRRAIHRVYEIGRDYRMRLEGAPGESGRGPVFVRAWGRDYSVRLDPGAWEEMSKRMSDLFLKNFFLPAMHPAQVIDWEFGPAASRDAGPRDESYAGLSALILRDMAKNPGFWTQAGIDLEEFVNRLGSFDRAVYEAR